MSKPIRTTDRTAFDVTQASIDHLSPTMTQGEKAALMRRFIMHPQTVEESAARMAEAIVNDTDEFLPAPPNRLDLDELRRLAVANADPRENTLTLLVPSLDEVIDRAKRGEEAAALLRELFAACTPVRCGEDGDNDECVICGARVFGAIPLTHDPDEVCGRVAEWLERNGGME